MRKFLLILLLVATTNAISSSLVVSDYDERLATAIYWAEGGPKAKVPYGILSISVADEPAARRACLVTIRNSRRRWEAAGARGDYLEFLARRYCPPNSAAWLKNVRFFLNKS
jgi:hypothetical protein